MHPQVGVSNTHLHTHPHTGAVSLVEKTQKMLAEALVVGALLAGASHTHYRSKVGPHIALPSLFPLLKVLATQAPTTSSTHLKPR